MKTLLITLATIALVASAGAAVALTVAGQLQVANVQMQDGDVTGSSLQPAAPAQHTVSGSSLQGSTARVQ